MVTVKCNFENAEARTHGQGPLLEQGLAKQLFHFSLI